MLIFLGFFTLFSGLLIRRRALGHPRRRFPFSLLRLDRDWPFSRSGNLPGRGGSFPRFKPAACRSFGCICPSSIRLSFCAANLRNTSPRCCLICPNSVSLLHLGMNTTWYLHSHLL